jgi:hypothetical protein
VLHEGRKKKKAPKNFFPCCHVIFKITCSLAGYISVEHRTDRGCSLAVLGCLTVTVLECSISNTLLILVCYIMENEQVLDPDGPMVLR